jgi:hypothetical protein
MDFGDERASGVNDAEGAVLGFLTNGGRHTMGAKHEYRAVRNVIDRLYEDGAATAQLLHDVGVVHDFVMDVNRSAVGFQSEFDDIDGPDDTRTESTGTDAK